MTARSAGGETDPRRLDPLDYGVTPLSARLTPEDAADLAARASRAHFPDRQSIFARGERRPQFCLVVEGGVRLSRTSLSGKRVSGGLLGPGQHFGYATAALGRERIYDVIAVGETVIDRIAADDVTRLVERSPRLALALLRDTTERAALLMQLLDDVRLLPPAARIARLLGDSLRTQGGNQLIRCLHEDIAAIIGVSSMTVAKALGELAALGLVETAYRCVRLPDPPRLRAWLRTWDA
ncbi:MAG: Crp/Fnr family transcriptional regulator [Phenylobacterium sp.]|uniref:Crp/Fnr family transcriptional regulator n=1 Tax=Phenylobacterium sp. TaxID=1871053 RepID=UPI001A38C076|nr:Crp/Fnr family transcriptional regulator [Phenylobacterium sp.]MBL8772012.1 Crp/Fnr family transcriptional regulator [Phenylobacterium sp.]